MQAGKYDKNKLSNFGLKERIEYLEKENKDLNDYILLTNEKLKQEDEKKRHDQHQHEVMAKKQSREQQEAIEMSLQKVRYILIKL